MCNSKLSRKSLLEFHFARTLLPPPPVPAWCLAVWSVRTAAATAGTPGSQPRQTPDGCNSPLEVGDKRLSVEFSFTIVMRAVVKHSQSAVTSWLNGVPGLIFLLSGSHLVQRHSGLYTPLSLPGFPGGSSPCHCEPCCPRLSARVMPTTHHLFPFQTQNFQRINSSTFTFFSVNVLELQKYEETQTKTAAMRKQTPCVHTQCAQCTQFLFTESSSRDSF